MTLVVQRQNKSPQEMSLEDYKGLDPSFRRWLADVGGKPTLEQMSRVVALEPRWIATDNGYEAIRVLRIEQ